MLSSRYGDDDVINGECVHFTPWPKHFGTDPEQVLTFYKNHYMRMAEEDLVPKLISMDGEGLITEKCIPLISTIENITGNSRDKLKECLINRIRKLHALGICHRDLHIRNIVLRHYIPLFVDFELAIVIDPSCLCYDLNGPVSKIPVPDQHVMLGSEYEVTGEWWNAEHQDSLSRYFGKVSSTDE